MRNSLWSRPLVDMMAGREGEEKGRGDPAWVCIAELPIAADVSHAIAAEFVVDKMTVTVTFALSLPCWAPPPHPQLVPAAWQP